MSQKTITVGTVGTPADLDVNFGNAQDNFTELYNKDIVTKTAAAGNTFIKGNVGYLDTTDTIILADADFVASAHPMLYMATDTIEGGASGVFIEAGKLNLPAHGFDIGKPLFISTDAGVITNTAPASGKQIRMVGYATDANTVKFTPDETWAEVA